MSILVGNHTRLLVQGITGKEGAFQTRRCIEYGTNVVAGVTPGRGGETAEGVSVFDTVAQAVAQTGANCSLRKFITLNQQDMFLKTLFHYAVLVFRLWL